MFVELNWISPGFWGCHGQLIDFSEWVVKLDEIYQKYPAYSRVNLLGGTGIYAN